MKFSLIFSILFFLGHPAVATNESAVENPTRKNQLEELFIWKLSDELRLTPAKEKQFADLIREINQKKFLGGLKIEEMTKTFIQSKESAAREKNFKNLRKAYSDYNQLSVYELDRLKKIIGLESVSTYLQVKQELSLKVKSLLMQGDRKDSDDLSEKKDSPILPSPKVIIVPSKKEEPGKSQ